MKTFISKLTSDSTHKEVFSLHRVKNKSTVSYHISGPSGEVIVPAKYLLTLIKVLLNQL